MPRPASSASKPDSVETPGENACANAVEVVGHEIAAVTVGPDANELDAGVERPQRLEEGLHGAARRTRRGMHAEAARQDARRRP